MPITEPRAVGRFAPTPSGPLHVGSLVAALASYLDIHAAAEVEESTGQRRWHVRIDDLDQQRSKPEFADDILRVLDACGLHWDGAVVYQSQQQELYHQYFTQLVSKNRLFGCACSRKELRSLKLPAGLDGSSVYPGNCRNKQLSLQDHAVRCRVEGRFCFKDRLQGVVQGEYATQVGDFVVRRADGQYAYHLAVVADDHAIGATQIVRGLDLLGCTAAHLAMYDALDLAMPTYAHTSLAAFLDRRNGVPAAVKFSKQTGAQSIESLGLSASMVLAALVLGFEIPPSLHGDKPSEILRWLLDNWKLTPVQQQDQMVIVPLPSHLE